LSTDAKIIVALLREQPQSIDKICTSAGISKRTFYYKRAVLEKSGIIREVDGDYALWTYVEAEKAVMETIRQWRRIGFRDPTPMEIADETGLSPAKTETLARKTKDKTGWAMPNDAAKQGAAEKLGEVLICAARKRNGTRSNFDYDKYPDDPELLEEAERFLKERPEMLPQLLDDEEHLSWPQDALKYLPMHHKPRDRHVATFFVVNSRK